MTDKEASEIIQNLVTMHRNIQGGGIDRFYSEEQLKEMAPFNRHKRLLFYYESLSTYAYSLDNYMFSTKGIYPNTYNISTFENDVRDGINEMIRFVGNYHTNITNKADFITETGIKEVFDILNIDVDDVLCSIREIHNSSNITESKLYSTYFDDLLKKTDFYGESRIQAIKNVKRNFEEDETRIFHMAIHLENENLLKVRKKEKLKNFIHLVKGKIKK